MRKTHTAFLSLFSLGIAASPAALVWQVGMDDNGWPAGDGGGPNATFVQEAGTNPLPGDPNSPEINGEADDDYYFAGVYSTVLDGGTYTPVGVVSNNEEAAERAFAGTDNSLRYHFNLPNTVLASDLLTVTFDANNLDTNGTTPRYGVEIYFNGTLVMPEVEVNTGNLDFDFTTPQFTLDSVNAQVGSGFDNYVELRGINYSAEGGGSWMGVDYVQLDATPIPEPSSPLLLLVGGTVGAAFLRRRRK